MKKVLILGLMVGMVQMQFLINAEQNINQFKHLHKLEQSSELRRNCLDSLKNGDSKVVIACSFLDNDLNRVIEFHTERRKVQADRDMSLYQGGIARFLDGLKSDPSDVEAREAIKTIVPHGDQKKEYFALCVLAAHINQKEYLIDLKNDK